MYIYNYNYKSIYIHRVDPIIITIVIINQTTTHRLRLGSGLVVTLSLNPIQE